MPTLSSIPSIQRRFNKTGCCGLISPEDWDEKVIELKDKLFAKAITRSFMHVPLNIHKVMSSMQASIDENNIADDSCLVLSKDISPWHAEHYFSIDHEANALQTERLSGTFLTKVFEGPYKDMPKWHKQLADYVDSYDEQLIDTYFYYTTCPNCAKEYGENYVVGFAQIK